MRVLLFCIQFPPDTNATGQLMSQLASGLVAIGHEVTVVTTFPHYEEFRVRDQYRGRLFARTFENGLEVLRLFTYAPGKKSMINRLLSYLVYNVLAVSAVIFSHRRWDIILAPNGSFFTGITSWAVGRLKKIPFIYNVQDLYPDVPIRAGQLKNRVAIWTLQKIERFMYRKAEHITVIAPALRENLLMKEVPVDKISVIGNFVDTDFIRPLPKENDFGQRNGLRDKFVVTHAGNLGFVYDLETMLDAASLISNHDDILFLIVGNGVARPALETKARELGLANVRFLRFQPREDLPWLRASSDVQLSLYKSGAAGESFPSKIYEAMASARPLLASADADSNVDHLVQSSGCGVCIRPRDPENLAQAILELYRDPLLREKMGARGRCYAEEHCSKYSVIARYDDLFLDLSVSSWTDFARIACKTS